MGTANSQNDKITIDQKLQFIETKVSKTCNYHRRQCVLYCGFPNCQKSPYVCQDCIRQNTHTHQQGIHKLPQFLKFIVNLIQLKRTQQQEYLQASMANLNKDYTGLYKQQIKLMESVDILQKQIDGMINEFRQKLQTNIDRLAKKVNKTYQIKTSTYINFYRNPNILACKLATQPGDKFLLQLKNQLRTVKRKNMVINEEEQFGQLKLQFGNIKSQIRDMLNITNFSTFTKKYSNIYTGISPVFKKTFVLPNSQTPSQMFLAGSCINITSAKQVYNVQILSKQPRKISGQAINIFSSKKQGQQFIGLLNQTKLLVYDGKNINHISFATKISAVNILKSKRKIYGLLGQEEGVFNVIDLQQNKSAYHYRCGDQPLNFIQVCETNSTICCAGKKTPIYVFKYKSKFVNIEDLTQLEFQFVYQMNAPFFQGELQLMRINNSDLYLFGPYRNLIIFDLMLNTEIIKTEQVKKCGAFTHAQFLTLNDQQILVTVNQKQDFATVWYIDRMRKNVKFQQMLKGERAILSIACTKNQIWLVRDGLKNIDTFAV